MTNKPNYVFVYGTLRFGEGNWDWALKGRSDLIGYATAPGELYNLGSFPGVILPTTDDRALGKTVRGEVFAVDDATLRVLDRLEGEGRMYHRRTVAVNYTSLVTNDEEPPTNVFIYEYGRIPHRDALIPDGDWFTHKFSFQE